MGREKDRRPMVQKQKEEGRDLWEKDRESNQG